MADDQQPHAPLTALLGPTNTGKTHRAVERMLEHGTGMIGLPLRLLARELYDRITARVGERAVALVTGEEKRIPRTPRYWICTVEAMPVEREVDFLAVDEIQLAAHRARGHVFTDRLLHARGRVETWFLGAETMRPLVSRLLPTAGVRRHPRLSRLRFAGASSLAQLPPRSAIVAFGISEVYRLAERVRARHGGAAIVVGALSPRARNAQVALYQAGEVDYMVATDAIGMGLNMDVSHVAFAGLSKYDGREQRYLEAAELAQIAGRAGRWLHDGTFGTLDPCPPLPEVLARSIEDHFFPPERFVVWRSSDLDLTSVESLIDSLTTPSRRSDLRPVESASDFEVLVRLAAKPEIRSQIRGPERVALLWDVCQIPDYSKVLPEQHAKLVAEVFSQLTGPAGYLDPDWMSERISQLEETQGDVDVLMHRIELVRTWSYISHQQRWLADPRAFQERTERLEEQLSDALHQRLVERFVDRGGGKHSPRARKRPRSLPTSRDDLSTTQRDSPFAKLLDLKGVVSSEPSFGSSDDDTWAHEIADASHDQLQLDSSGRILAREEIVGRLIRGADVLHPEVKVQTSRAFGSGARSRVTRRLLAYARDVVDEMLEPVRTLASEHTSAAARGLCYQVEQGLGTCATEEAKAQVDLLTESDRRLLGQRGVVVGACSVYVRLLLKPKALVHRAALTSTWTGAAVPPALVSGIVSLVESGLSHQQCIMMGYRRIGPRVIRADVLERVVTGLTSPTAPPRPSQVAAWLGASRQEARAVAQALKLVPRVGKDDSSST